MPSHPSHPSHRTRAQQRIDEIDVSPTKLLAEIERLKAEAEAARAQADEYLTALQRERAEFLNFKRRTPRIASEFGLAAEDLIRRYGADDFDRAIEALPTPSPGIPGSTASVQSIASCASCSKVRASARSTRRQHAIRSTRRA
jgi:hypothetical protein